MFGTVLAFFDCAHIAGNRQLPSRPKLTFPAPRRKLAGAGRRLLLFDNSTRPSALRTLGRCELASCFASWADGFEGNLLFAKPVAALADIAENLAGPFTGGAPH